MNASEIQHQLILKYLDATLSPEEQQQFDQLLHSSRDFRLELEHTQRTIAGVQAVSHLQERRQVENLIADIAHEQILLPNARRLPFSTGLGLAAAITILLLISRMLSFETIQNAVLNNSAVTEASIDVYNKQTNVVLEDNIEKTLLRIDSAISMSKNISYPYGEAYALYQKGYLLDEKNEAGKALIANLNALKILDALESERVAKTSVSLYINTGLILRQHFKYEEAIQYYKEGLKLAESYKLTDSKSRLYYKIGNAYKHLGDLETAVRWLSKAHNNSLTNRDERTAINSLNLMGIAYKNSGDFRSARKYFNMMLDHNYSDINPLKYFGQAYHNIAYTYFLENELEKAELYYNKSLEYKKGRNKVSELFITRHDLAEVHLATGELAKAEKLATYCEAHFSLLRKIAYQKGDIAKVEAYAARYQQESELFIADQEELIKISDQFQMDVLTDKYFIELDWQQKVTERTNYMYYIAFFLLICYMLWEIRRLYVIRTEENELYSAFHDLNREEL